jgi:hypothetical protein
MGKSRFRKILTRGAFLALVGFLLLIIAHEWLKGLPYLAFHEIGFALLVSVVIWGLFEHVISTDAEEVWDRRMERLTNNVFQAVLRKDLPKGLLDEANNLVLNNAVVRRNFQVTYTLSDVTVSDVDPCLEAVAVQAVMEFEMENVSTDVFDWDVKLALPNPVHPSLKRLVEVSGLEVTKGNEVLQLDLEAAREAFQAALAQVAATHIPFRAGTVKLNPGETCRFSATYMMIKEGEDSEYLQTLYPADGLRITLFDPGAGTKRLLFASAVHRHELEATESSSIPKARIFRIPGYLLPHQGVLIWWKKKPTQGAMPLPDGIPGDTAPTE